MCLFVVIILSAWPTTMVSVHYLYACYAMTAAAADFEQNLAFLYIASQFTVILQLATYISGL